MSVWGLLFSHALLPLELGSRPTRLDMAAASASFSVGQPPFPQQQLRKNQFTEDQVAKIIQVRPPRSAVAGPHLSAKQKVKALSAAGYTPQTSPELANYLKVLEICSQQAPQSTSSPPLLVTYCVHCRLRQAHPIPYYRPCSHQRDPPERLC